jgi:hypothetical protein
MTKKAWRWMGSGALCLLAIATAAPAQQGQQKEMSAEEKAMMEAWMKAMTPGAEHQLLTSKVGNWEAKVSSWMAPGAPPEVSQARATRKAALGGRVLIDEWSGTMMGMPFEGLGTSGFDNVSKTWWSTWSDNMSTGVMNSTGACDDAKKSCTFTGVYMDPITGKEKKSRQVVTWTSANDEKMEMFDIGPDGKEFRMMEIVMKKAAN